jgi:hypothetical protein
MKREIYRKSLLGAILLMVLILGSSTALKAQGITMYQYRHVAPDKVDEFIKRETTYWSKVAQKAIDNGKMTFWALFEKVGGVDMSTSSNFLFINTYPDMDANFGDIWNPAKLFPGVPMDKMSTESISTTTAEVFVKSDGWQQVANANPSKDFNYVVMNYHNSSNPSSFVTIEKNQWGPFIQASMDNKLTEQKAWGNAIVLSPTGGPMKYNCLSYDLYATSNAALLQPWKPETKFPTEGLDSLQKISLDPPVTFLYRVVKVVSEKSTK